MPGIRSYNKVVIYHVGARDNYSAALVFKSKDILQAFYTDYWSNGKKGFPFNRIGQRRNNYQLSKIVRSYSLLKVLLTESLKRFHFSRYEGWSFSGSQFASFVRRRIADELNPKGRYILWGYTGGNLEVLKHFKDNDRFFSIHNQIDPGLAFYEQDLGWDMKGKAKYLKRLQEEWDLADAILVNSNFSKSSMISRGADREKLIVVPLIYKVKDRTLKRKFNDRLKIAFIGNINKVKGFDTFAEVAEKLEGICDFVAAGSSTMNSEYMKFASQYVLLLGFLSKDEMVDLYNSMDLLIFPTTCDGFGMVQLEAMAHGIPVLATKNCAEVVEHGKSGFIFESNEELVGYIEHLDQNRSKLQRFSECAFKRVLDFDEDNFISALRSGMEKFNVSLPI